MNYFEMMCLETGYEGKTTFWTDFAIAEHFGNYAIKDTYNRAFNEWKLDTEFITELTMVLNWKMWYFDGLGKRDLSMLYQTLWEKCDNWCYKNLKGEDLRYFLKVTD